MNILMVGDVYGEPGRAAIATLLPELRQELAIDFCVVNVENAAGGFGVTPPIARRILDAGADVMTSGNHIWDKKEIVEYIVKENLLLRPANFPAGTPGVGHVTIKCGPHKVAVLNLMGRVFMLAIDCPFRKADALIPELRKETPIILVDMHAEATSEALAMGWYLDGRGSAVVGTHRRVPARDEPVLPCGTDQCTALGVTPMLAVVLVGDFEPSKIYVANKKKAAANVGVATRDYVYPTGLTQRELLTLLRTLNAEDDVHGVLLQLPLVEGCDEDEAIATIAPEKDVDGLHPTNLGRLLAGAPTVVPCTAAGCLEILDHYGAKLEGAEAVVIGRSRLVGKPLAQLLLARHATVTTCHTRTRDLAAHARRADVLCVAAGRPHMITGDLVRQGAWVNGVGVNRPATGQLVGDGGSSRSVSRRCGSRARPRSSASTAPATPTSP